MEEKIESLLEFLENSKAKDISLYDASGIKTQEKYIVLANFASCIENKNFVESFMKKFGLEDFPEGYNKGEWIVILFDDILIHTFTPSKREKYNLDKLYQNLKVNLKQNKKAK